MKREQQIVKPERRFFNATDIHVERRADESAEGEDSTPKIVGYAAVFNDQVEFEGWRFREQIAEGAFAKSITEDDVRALWNHDSNFPLGRNKAGTLRLEEDSHGLKIEIDPPDTQVARDLAVSIERGDVTQMSFGFYVQREEWEKDGDWDNRTILEASLFDVSPVTFPAYPSTEVSVARESISAALESRDAWRDADQRPSKSKATIEIGIELTDEARDALDQIDKSVHGASTRLAEMKKRQKALEDSIHWLT